LTAALSCCATPSTGDGASRTGVRTGTDNTSQRYTTPRLDRQKDGERSTPQARPPGRTHLMTADRELDMTSARGSMRGRRGGGVTVTSFTSLGWCRLV
jgi:hypothetical protein